MHLQDVKQGMIHIRLWWLSLSSDYTDLEAVSSSDYKYNLQRTQNFRL
jgi:hypothetical protein